MVAKKRKRQEQRYYTGMQVNRAPVISTRKRVAHRQQPDADTVFTLLNAQIRNRLHSKIVKCLKDNSPPATLKATCTSMTQLERGIVSEAETAGNLPTTTIRNFLNKYNQAHQTKSIDLWKDYVAKHFDEIVVEEMAKLAAAAEEAEAEGADDAGADQDVETVARVPEDAVRSCTVSLSAIIRQDLPDELKREFAQRLSRTIVDATNYITAYGLQLYKLMILFKDHTFEVGTNNAVIIQGRRGFHCGAILPDWVLLENAQAFVAPPLQTEALELDGFANQYKKLFNDAYLELVQSEYFGPQGASPASLASNPLFSAVRSIIPRDEQNLPELDPFVMRTTLSQYKTNLANMWNSKRFTKLLNNLLMVLLRLHLAPQREQKKRDYIEKKKQTATRQEPRLPAAVSESIHGIPADRISVIHLSRDQKRNLFDKERKKHIQYTNKAKLHQDPAMKRKYQQWADRSLERIDTYRKVLQAERQDASETQENEEEEEPDDAMVELEIQAEDSNVAAAQELNDADDEGEDNTRDAPRRRIQSLVATVRNTLFENQGKTIVPANLKTFCKDLTDVEMEPCLLICNMIMPYVPAKKNWFSLPYQLPFVLMANELLRLTGYSKFAVSISPLTMPGKLNCLPVDAPMLFSLFCSPKIPRNVTRLDIFDFQGRQIVSKEDAASNKDAIFSSFFDIQRLQAISNSYGLIFAQSVVIYPGAKTVTLRGFMKKQPAIAASDPKAKQAKPTPVKDKDTPLARAVKEADQAFKALCAKRRDMLKETSLRAEKKRWSAASPEERPAIGLQIQEIKKARQRINTSIARAKQRLQLLRRQRYEERTPGKTKDGNQDASPKVVIDHANKPVLLKAEQTTIQDNILSSPDTSFGGTDNGLVKMAETCRFDLKRFNNHLQLYNYYSCLNDFDDESSECQDDDDGTESDGTENEKDDLDVLFRPPPKTMTIDAKDIQHRSGDKAFSQHLTRRKKRTTNGQLVIAAEQQMSRAHLPSATLANVDQVITDITQHRDLLRSFYYSESLTRRKRRQVKRRRRYLDIVCRDEREFVNGGPDKEKGAVVLFVGDRGYATGSRIKGFLRYGGKWKPSLHARYTTTLITNEHNTSQTCVYCFQKTMHPTSMTNGKLKTIKGTSVCTNPHCVLVKKRMSHQSRDAVSSLAIGMTGLHAAIFGSPLGPFNPKIISQYETDKIHDATTSFCKRSEEGLELDELDT